jgi:hypothetical protein
MTPASPCALHGRRFSNAKSILEPRRVASMRCAAAGGAIAVGKPPMSS